MFSAASFFGRASVLLASLALFAPACKDQEDDPSEADTDDMGSCPDCEPGQEAYLCILNGEENLLCFEDLGEAQASCGVVPGNGVVGNAPVPCENQEPEEEVPWTPGSFVEYDDRSRTFEVDRKLLTVVLEDPRLLLNDRARLEWRGDHFEFEDVAKGDLVERLGFRDGDVLVEINGYPLATMSEVGKAYDALRRQSSFAVVVERRQSTTVLEYRVVDDA